MQTELQPRTAEELFRMPDDGFRHELVKGELRTMTPAGTKHGRLVIKLASLLFQHVEANALGEVFGPDTGFKIADRPTQCGRPTSPLSGNSEFQPENSPRRSGQERPTWRSK